jgi:hypothetical protein
VLLLLLLTLPANMLTVTPTHKVHSSRTLLSACLCVHLLCHKLQLLMPSASTLQTAAACRNSTSCKLAGAAALCVGVLYARLAMQTTDAGSSTAERLNASTPAEVQGAAAVMMGRARRNRSQEQRLVTSASCDAAMMASGTMPDSVQHAVGSPEQQ